MLKQAGYIILIILLMMQSGGILLFYHLQQSMVQFETQQKLSNHENVFERIIVSKAEFQENRINSREVLLNGKMYDIKSIHYKGKQVTLFAKHDRQEEKIIQKIKAFISLKHSQKTIPDHFVKMFSLIYIVPLFCQDILFNEMKQNVFQPYADILITTTRKVVSPPPDKV